MDELKGKLNEANSLGEVKDILKDYPELDTMRVMLRLLHFSGMNPFTITIIGGNAHEIRRDARLQWLPEQNQGHR